MYKYAIIILFLSSCASMSEMTVYQDFVEQTEGINGFTSIDIFTQGGRNEVWGNKEDEQCNPFSFSALDASVDYTVVSQTTEKIEETIQVDVKRQLPTVKVKDKKNIEKNSLHIKTDKPSFCKWIGMGIGWDGWQGKDLSGIMTNTAIEFMARVDGNPMYNIPIVFILEDYAENQCYATAGYLGIEGGEITEKWTRVVIPLPTFSYAEDNIDLTNIKQLLLQCYDKVDVYIDDIKIVEHEHHYKKISPSLSVIETTLPIDIFSEELSSIWGINSNYCKNIIMRSDENYPSGKYIDVAIDFERNKCNWKDFGISWNDWLYTDLSSSIHGVYLEFDINLNEYKGAKISFEDYNGKKMAIDLENYLMNVSKGKWEKVRIPMNKFPIRASSIDLKRIKNIIFAFEDKAKLKIDNIKLTN